MASLKILTALIVVVTLASLSNPTSATFILGHHSIGGMIKGVGTLFNMFKDRHRNLKDNHVISELCQIKQQPRNFDECIDISWKLTYGFGKVIDASYIHGLGDLICRIYAALIKTSVCIYGPKDCSACKQNYYGVSEVGNSVSEVISKYKLENCESEFNEIINKYTNGVGIKKFTGSRKTFIDAVYKLVKIVQGANITKEHLTTVIVQMNIIWGIIGNSCSKDLGTNIVGGYLNAISVYFTKKGYRAIDEKEENTVTKCITPANDDNNAPWTKETDDNGGKYNNDNNKGDNNNNNDKNGNDNKNKDKNDYGNKDKNDKDVKDKNDNKGKDKNDHDNKGKDKNDYGNKGKNDKDVKDKNDNKGKDKNNHDNKGKDKNDYGNKGKNDKDVKDKNDNKGKDKNDKDNKGKDKNDHDNKGKDKNDYGNKGKDKNDHGNKGKNDKDVKDKNDNKGKDKNDKDNKGKDKNDHGNKGKDKNDHDNKGKDKNDKDVKEKNDNKGKDKNDKDNKGKDKNDHDNKGKDKNDHDNKGKDKNDHDNKGKDKNDHDNKGKDKNDHYNKGKDKNDHDNKGKGKNDHENKGKDKNDHGNNKNDKDKKDKHNDIKDKDNKHKKGWRHRGLKKGIGYAGLIKCTGHLFGGLKQHGKVKNTVADKVTSLKQPKNLDDVTIIIITLIQAYGNLLDSKLIPGLGQLITKIFVIIIKICVCQLGPGKGSVCSKDYYGITEWKGRTVIEIIKQAKLDNCHDQYLQIINKASNGKGLDYWTGPEKNVLVACESLVKLLNSKMEASCYKDAVKQLAIIGGVIGNTYDNGDLGTDFSSGIVETCAPHIESAGLGSFTETDRTTIEVKIDVSVTVAKKTAWTCDTCLTAAKPAVN